MSLIHTSHSPDTLPPLLTRKQAASHLAISERHLWTITQSGGLPAIKIGRLVRYSRADLDAYVARSRSGSRSLNGAN